MVNKQRGKKILKSKPQRDFISITFVICGGGLMMCWIFIRIYFILRQNYILGLLDFFLFIGFTFLWIGMGNLIIYVILYENGVRVRKKGVINYVKTRFIDYSLIREVCLRGKEWMFPQFIIRLDTEEISFPMFLIQNHKKIMQEISNQIERFNSKI